VHLFDYSLFINNHSIEVREMDDKIKRHIAKLIEKEVAYFNGWCVPETVMVADCKKAADKIAKYLDKKLTNQHNG